MNLQNVKNLGRRGPLGKGKGSMVDETASRGELK